MREIVDFILHDDLIFSLNNNLSKSVLGGYRLNFLKFDSDLNGYEGEIVDLNNNAMPFLFRPAKNIKIARTLVILHGHGSNQSYSKFYDPNWNVIVPLDRFGTDGLGSWWLGDGGDLKTFNLFQNLMKILQNFFSFSSLYFWGSSMGGYGALLHGFLLKASAIYSHIPQSKLNNTEYTDGINAKYYLHLIHENNNAYLDLSVFLKNQRLNKSPVLFLSQNSMDRKKYATEHFLPLIRCCDSKGFAYSVSMPLISGHNQHLSVAQSVKLYFEDNYKKIKRWRLEQSI